MSRKPQTRYPHVFSKGKGPGFHSQGSWRGAYAVQLAAERAAAKERVDTKRTKPTKEAHGAASPAGGRGGPEGVGEGRGQGMTMDAKPLYPLKLDPQRWKYLKISPTIANLYKGHLGLAVICADCCRGVGHRNPGLPDRFKRQWHLTLIEIEQRCRCEACGSRNARVYPWAGDFDGPLGLEGPPEERR